MEGCLGVVRKRRNRESKR